MCEVPSDVSRKFKKYGKRGVCIDAMYRVNDYDFHLITILVLDDFQEGIPVAWALANSEDKIAIVHILLALREQSGLIMTRQSSITMQGKKCFLPQTQSTCGAPGTSIEHGGMG